ncbi:major tail protein [Gordonia phage Jeanie]|uniref:Major tail protein n=2 Tax=root TaxID=1 RepID=A0A160DHL4_9CAUD|nr:hypothetical protein [Gordonia neofelifaecis]YP_009274022.1 major tail protein [Gordonia phage McGonagall]ANA87588.1 major tail protein [Gordonia phage McGonagall]ANA87615.1 major tail protein [Gordonia phage Jeanie]EGD53215.1 hypothetical protein SCNU_20047 [Gordonia neofelifaecis NRRL B-59395]
MAIKRPIPALGPGSLIFGEVTADQLDISCQVTAAKITFDSDKEDDLPTLCGGVITGEKTYTSKLEFSAAQDLEENGLIDWTWANAGKEVPFKFVPLESEVATITGVVVIDPVEFGGDVKKRNISDAEFDLVGLPTFTPDATPDSTEYPPAVPAP